MHGPINRQGDIARTASTLLARQEYLAFCVRRDTSPQWRTLHCANASDISDGAFRQLFTFVAYAKKGDLSNSRVSHKTIAAITGRSERASKRATEELEEGGWIGTKRTRREEAIRTIKIPKVILDAIPDEGIGTRCSSAENGTSSDSRSAKSDTSKSLEVPKSTLRSAKNGPLTSKNQDDDTDDSASATRSAKNGTSRNDDAKLYLDAINAFCRDPRNLATVNQPVMSEEDAARGLAGWMQAWERQAPLETVLRCLPSVLTEMQIRARDPAQVKRGDRNLSGFAGYLRKIMNTALSDAVAAGKAAVESTPKTMNGHAKGNGADPPLSRVERIEALVKQRTAQREKKDTQ
jgi:hypothetical protein